STTPLHARPAASTVVDHWARDPSGHWRPGGGDSAKRKAPDRSSIDEVSAKRSGGQSRRSALSGPPLIACHNAPTVVRCGMPASTWYSTINRPPSTMTPASAPASPRNRPTVWPTTRPNTDDKGQFRRGLTGTQRRSGRPTDTRVSVCPAGALRSLGGGLVRPGAVTVTPASVGLGSGPRPSRP